MMPQLFWELEHPRASSETLAFWWDDYANERHMYYGQSVKITMEKADIAPSTNKTQLDHKIQLSRELENVQGNCWWPGYEITKNYLGVADSLANNQQSTIAIIPPYTWITDSKPSEVAKLKYDKDEIGRAHV